MAKILNKFSNQSHKYLRKRTRYPLNEIILFKNFFSFMKNFLFHFIFALKKEITQDIAENT